MNPAAAFALPPALAATLLADARAAGRWEICGFLAGEPTDRDHYPIANIAGHRGRRFDMDPAEQIAVFRTLRQRATPLAAIYHSHPRGEAEPSAADIAGHSYPQTPALIIAPNAVTGALLRAWAMDQQTPREIEITESSGFL